MYIEEMTFRIKSVSPILFNRRSLMLEMEMDPSLLIKTKPKEGKLEYQMRIWQKRAYVNAEGKIFIPATYFSAGFRESQKSTRCAILPEGAKKGSLLNYLSSVQPETITTDFTVDDLHPYADIVVLTTGFKKTSMPCVRPQLSYEVDLKVISASELVTIKQVRPMLEYVGSFLGIGDYTPRCSGRFGRFEVLSAKSKILS